MKKFMIFLLMAFLYIGTCQARSESAHPNDAQLKLLSWVSPTPSQSFMTRSVEGVAAAGLVLTVDGSATISLGEETATLVLCPNEDALALVAYALGQAANPEATWAEIMETASLTWTINSSSGQTLERTIVQLGEGYGEGCVLATFGETTPGQEGYYVVTEPGDYVITATVSGSLTANSGYNVPFSYTSEPVTITVDPAEEDDIDCSFTLSFTNNAAGSIYEGDELSETLNVYEGDESMCYVNVYPTTPSDQLYFIFLINDISAAWAGGNSESIIKSLSDIYSDFVADESYTITVIAAYDENGDNEAQQCGDPQSVTVYIEDWDNPDDPPADDCNLSDVTIENTATGESWTIMEQGNQSAPEIIVTTDDVANLKVTMSGNPSEMYSVSYGDALSTFGGEGLLSLMLFPNGLEAGNYLISFDALNANYVPCEVGGEFEITVVENSTPVEPCELIVVKDENGDELINPAGEQTAALEVAPGDQIQLMVEFSAPYYYFVDWTLDQEQISYNQATVDDGVENITLTLPTTLAEGEHVIAFFSDIYDNETYYVTCGKEITLTVTEGEEPFDPCQTVPVFDGTGYPVTEVTLHAGDGPVTLSIGYEAIEISGWTTDYPEGFEEEDPYDVATLPGPTATTTPGDYTVTVNFEIFGVFSQLDGGTYIELAEPVECHNTVILHVQGSEEPTPTPIPPTDNPVWVNLFGNTTVCPDDEVTLIAYVTPEGTAVSNYVWIYQQNVIMDSPNQPHTGPMFTFVPSQFFGDSEDRTIAVEVAYGDCSNPRDSVVIKYLPEAPTIHIAINPDTICVGGQITATIEFEGDDWDEDEWLNNPIFSWYVNGVELPGEHMGEITLNMPMAGAYGFAAKLNTPVCGVSVQSEPDTVYVFDALPLTITGDNVVCQNDTATLTATPIEGAEYAWAGPDITGANGNVLVTTIPGVYAVTATMGSGCFATAEFTVYQFGGDLQVTADQMNVCPGTTVMLNANLDGWFNENISYKWSTNDTSSTIAAVVDQTTTFYVTASAQPQTTGMEEDNSKVCQLTSSITINAVTNQNITTTVQPNSENLTFCLGDQVTLTASSSATSTTAEEQTPALPNQLDVVEVNEVALVDAQAASDPDNDATYTYIWYKNGIVIPGENQPTITVNLNQAGNYSFRAKAVVGDCNTAEVSNEVTVNVYDAPTVTITGTQELAEGQTTATLTVSVLPEDGSYIYSWSNGTESPEATSITVDQAGVYNVTVTYGNNCKVVSAPFQVNTVTPFDPEIEGDGNICYGEDLEVELVIRDAEFGNCDQVRWKVEGQYVPEKYLDPSNPSHFEMSSVDLYSEFGLLNFTLTAEVYCEGSCKTPTTQNFDVEITVPVNLDKIVVLNNGEDADHVCEGAQLDLSVMVRGEEGEASYEDNSLTYVWTRNGVVIPGVNGPRFSEQAWIYDSDPMTYVYTVFVQYANGCQSLPVGSDTVYVRRNPIVVIDGNPNVCYNGLTQDANVKLVAWVDGGPDLSATYAWYESGQLRDVPVADYLYEERHDPTYDNPLIFTVEVTNGNGCSTISEPFYVNVYDAPVVNITGDANAICTNGSVELRANLDNYNDPMLVFQWYKNVIDENTLIPGATHEIETFYPTEPTTYWVQVTHLMDYSDPGNCVGQSQFQVGINGIPVVTVHNDLDTDETNVNEICEGRSITFTAHTEGGIEGEAVYTWYRNGELVENVTGDLYVDAPLAVEGVPTTYIYSVIVNQGFSGCESELTYFDTITVNPNPAIQLVSDPIICSEEGDNVVLTANMDVVPTGVQFRWLEDNVEFLVTDTNAISLHKDYSENPYNFSVQIVNTYGCTGEALATVYVNDAPIVNITASDSVICEGGVITLAAALNDWGATDLNYRWFDGTREIDGATTLTYTVNSAELGEHQYHIVIDQTTSGCQATSHPVIVNVVEKPVIDTVVVDNMPEDGVVCDGYQITLTANVQGGVSGGEVFTWYRNGVEIVDATLATLSDVLTAVNGETTTYTYSVVVAQATSGCVSEIYEVDPITVNPNPVLQLVTNPIVCNDEGENITLTANLNPAIEGATFKWFEDNVEMDPETYTVEGNNTIKLHKDYRYQPYSFSVELNNDYGCTSVSEALVYVNEAPVVNITASDTVVCQGGVTILTASLDDWNAETLIYKWLDGEDTIPGATSLVYEVAPEAGLHHYHLYIEQQSSGCTAESNVIDVTVTGAPVITSVGTPQTSICYGGQLAITAAPEGGNLDGDTYTWYRNGILMEGATAATIYDTPEIIDNNTQQYIYTAVLNRPAPGCTSDPVTSPVVTVYPNPTVVITGDQHVCETDSVFLIANVDTVGMNVGGLHYTWYESGQIRDNMAYNLGDNSFFAEYMYARTEPYRFTVDVWRDDVGAGCVSHSEEYLVYVYTQPVVNITATETEICENGQVTLTANLNDYNATDLIYQWYTVGEEMHVYAVDFAEDGGYVYDTVYTPVHNNIPGATSATFTTTLAETTTLGVMVRQTPSNCWATDLITINVNPIPVVTDIKVNALDTVNVCDGAQVTISADIDAYNAEGAVFTWFRNGELLEGITGPTFSENVYTDNENVTTYLYTAIVTLPASGCVSEMSADAGVVIVGNSPATVVVSGNTVICDGGFTTLYANVVPAQPATYEWFKDNVSMNIDTDNIIVTDAGSYKVVAYFNGCSTESDAVVVTVEETPQLQLTATESTICAGGVTVITAEATGWNNGNVNHNWSNGFQGSAFTFNPEFAGIYTFYDTVSQATSGCVAVDSIVINVNELPKTPVIVVDNAVVCDGGQVTLTVSNADSIGVNAVYTWYRNGVVIPGAIYATLTESPVAVDGDPTNYVYTVIATLPMSGCTSLVSENAIVRVIPTPVVAVSVEGNTALCEGGSTILHANVTPADTIYQYQWFRDNVLIEGATSADYVAADDARETAYIYSVVVSANPGCNVTAFAPAITFVADPVVVATISNNISCVGGTATLTAVVDGGVADVNGLNGYTFAWYRNYAINDDPSTPHSTSEFVSNAAEFTTTGTEDAGIYSYWVTVTSEYGCQTTSLPVNYTVIPDPVVTIVRIADMPETICDGGSTTLKAVVTGGYGDASYQWYKNGNIIVGETNQLLNIDMLAYGVNDVYSVEVIQTGVGCSNFGVAAINTLVTVVPTYTVDITGFGNVCEGGTLTLTATVNGVVPGDVLSYQWYRILNGNNAVAVSGANSPQYSTSDLLLGNSYDYYVVVTSTLSGCSVVSTSVPANVVPAPSVVIQGANTVCEGGDLTLNAFVTGGVEGDAYIYTWSWTGAASDTAITAVPTFVPTLAANDLATPYYFTVTISRADNTGCTATSAAHEVNVLAAPTVAVTADNSYVCQNGEVTFTANVSPVGAYNYVWTINGQQLAVNASTVTTSIANVGTISASVVVSAANASASCSASASIATPVQVVAAPIVTISADHTTMCVGGTTTLTSNVNANSNIPSNFNYQWAINGIEVPGAIASTFVQPLNAAGEYVYTLRVSQDNNLGCSSAWSAPVTVQVAEQPVVVLNSEDGLAICQGGTINMTAVVTNYGNTINGVTNSNIYGSMTFTWSSNGVNIVPPHVSSNAQDQLTQTLNNVGNYNYQVTVDPVGYNCQPQASNIQVVNVVGDPSWTEVHVYSNNGTDACLGEMVVLEAAIQGGVVDANYSTSGHIQWVVMDENGNTMDVSGGLGGSSYDIPSVAGTYVYIPTFVGNIGNGCQLTNTADVQVAVTVHELPTATFTSGDGASICSNDPSASAELVISFTGVAPFTYEVVDGHGNVVAHATTQANTATIYVAPTEQTTYRITLVQDAYCENTAFGTDAMATVYVNSIEFDDVVFESGCDNPGFVTINFNMISGNPTAAFTVIYDNGLQASGNISNNTATFAAPTVPGDYHAVFTVDGCSYDIIVRVLVGDYGFGGTLPIMDQRWNDVVVVNNNPANNGGHTFVSFQWYKNGVEIPGAVYSNYQEIGGLNGFYSVVLVEQDANGNMVTYQTCEMYFSSASTVKVYPVPANVRQEITIELDLTSEELDGAVLDIYSVTGSHISHVTDLQPITKIEGFKAQGTYFGRILTGTNEIKTVKFIIVK